MRHSSVKSTCIRLYLPLKLLWMETLTALPPGFGFHPTDVELVSHYLKRKTQGHNFDEIIPEVDIYKHEPWDLPAKCHVPTRDNTWHFFTLRERKYRAGSRSNRATEEGYWKSTGNDRNVKFQNRVIGTKKTLVYYEGRAPRGKRTDWIMHEYDLDEKECKASPGLKGTFVLCRLTKRNDWPLENEKTEPVVCKESSSHSSDMEDLDAWVAGLFDPNFGTNSNRLEHEAVADVGSLVPKQEPVDSHLDQSADGNIGYLLEDDACNILKSDSNNSFQKSNTGARDDVSTHGRSSRDVNVKKENPTFGHTASTNSYKSFDTGIQIRQRRAGPSAEVPSGRIRLQVSKVASRNSASVNHTIKVGNEGHHLDLNRSQNQTFSSGLALDQESAVVTSSVSYQFNAKSNPSSESDRSCPVVSMTLLGAISSNDVTLQKSSSAPLDDRSFIRGIDRGMGMLVPALQSACHSQCFILGACLAGTAALFIYFMLRGDAG
ncbi:NAC domain-containing protein 74 isoform X2 [Musa acuminata AAA Group]|uniref:NAC domain-containing protein 74 isoform X2 n=2 Tax=Musa acuminata AAA Group TaxID=214697 RepID=UPI0031DB6062